MVFAAIAFALLFVLLAGGMWIAFTLGTAGAVAMFPALGMRVVSLVGSASWDSVSSFLLVALPLFIFLGEIVSLSGIIDRLYRGVSMMLKGVPGGLLQSNIGACTVFAAVAGSSVACAATIGKVAYQEQVVKRGYPAELTLGSLAAGGTLGILIPPSAAFIIYGAIGQQSVSRLFIAGILPGLMLATMFGLYIAVYSRLRPQALPSEATGSSSFRTRVAGLLTIWPVLLLVAVILGSIYGGITTPTEAAGVGAIGALLLAAGYRKLSMKTLKTATMNTVKSTSMIFLILIAAKFLVTSLAYYRVSPMLQSFASSLGSPILLFCGIVLMYFILGMFFDGLSMVMITLPFVMPVIKQSGFDPVWFGVILVMLIEVGLLTPPLGLNLYVLQGATGEGFTKVAKGSVPFVIIILVAIAVLYLFPQLATWLPSLMKG